MPLGIALKTISTNHAYPGLTGGGVKTARPQLTDNHVAEMLHLVSIPARGITRYQGVRVRVRM